MNEHEVMTVGELAKYLRIHQSTVYRLLRRKMIPAWRIGSDWRFNREDIDKWRMAQEQNGNSKGIS